MLLGQNGSGYQNGYLLPVHDGFHHSPEGHFRFAEAHIAAKKPVHGREGFHISLDFGNTPKLIVCFRVGEVVLKFPLPGGVRGEGIAGLALSGGIELNQLSGHILGGFPCLGLGLLPGIGSDFVQAYISVFRAAADILAYQIQLGCRNKQGIRTLVSDFDIILDGTVNPDLLHSHKTADAVVVVYHQIPRGEVCKGTEFLPVGSVLFCLGLNLGNSFGYQLPFCENSQLGSRVFHAKGEGAIGEQNLPGFGHGGKGNTQKCTQTLFPQHLLQQFTSPLGAAEYQCGKVHLLVVGKVGNHRVHVAPVSRQLLTGNGVQGFGRAISGVGGAAEGIQVKDAPLFQGMAEVLPLPYIIAKLSGGKTGLEQAVQLHPHLLGSGASGSVDASLVAESDEGVVRDIVEGGGKIRVYQSHVPISGRMSCLIFQLLQILLQSAYQLLVGIFSPLLPGKKGMNILAQTGDSLGMHTQLGFPYGKNGNAVGIFRAPLGDGVEEAHGVQLVSKELRPDGAVTGRGENIQNAAPDGKLPGTFHHAAPAVPAGGELPAQLLQGVGTANFQGEDTIPQNPGRHGTKAHGFPGQNLHLGDPGLQVVKLANPLLLPLPGDHGVVIQSQLSAGKGRGGVAQKGRQLILQALGAHVVLAKNHQWPSAMGTDRSQNVAAVDLSDACDRRRMVLAQLRQKLVVFRKGLQCGKELIHRHTSYEKFSPRNNAERGTWAPFRVIMTIFLFSCSIEAVGCLHGAVGNNAQSSICGSLQSLLQDLFLGRGEGGQHPVSQVKIRTGLCANPYFHPGEVLTSQLGDDGLDSVVAAGGAVAPNPKAANVQGNVVKNHHNPLRRNVEVGGKLQHGPA